MKIIKHGDLEKLKQIKHFICQKCGCELEADNTEYQSRQVEYNDIGYFIKCPDCGYEIYWFKSNEKKNYEEHEDPDSYWLRMLEIRDSGKPFE